MRTALSVANAGSLAKSSQGEQLPQGDTAMRLFVPLGQVTGHGGVERTEPPVADRQAHGHRQYRPRHQSGGQQALVVVVAEVARQHRFSMAHD